MEEVATMKKLCGTRLLLVKVLPPRLAQHALASDVNQLKGKMIGRLIGVDLNEWAAYAWSKC